MNFKEFFGDAVWVAPNADCNTPYFRDTFDVCDVSKAEITACGLGFYYLYINGQKVSDDLFVTLATDYHEHFTVHGEELNHRLICQKYDVTKLVKDGKNAIGFLVGGGYYRYCDDYKPVLYDNVRICYRLEITDFSGKKQTFVSGSQTKWNYSFIKECDNFTLGETHDYNCEIKGWYLPDFCDSDWLDTEKVSLPPTHYEYMVSPADRIIRKGKPKLLYSDSDKKIYDVGENITGWVYIELKENSKSEIKVRFSEESTENMLNEDNCFGQYFNIIPDGKQRCVHPYLTWHGFRYVEVSGDADLFEYAVINSDVPLRTDFESSNDVLNWLYKAYVRTQLNNMHAGIPTDCPTIERRGYTGDGQLCAETGMLLFKSKSFYKKWINDILDCQDRKSGHVNYTAPIISSGGGPGGWGSAIVEVPYRYYKTFGEKEVLEKAFDGMLHYFDYLDSHSEDNLIVSDQPNCWCLGDWCTAEEIKIPEPYVNTYFYVKSLYKVIEIAKIIQKEEVIPKLKEKIKLLKSVIVNNYYDEKTGDFCSGVQGANAFACDIGLGDERTFKNMVSFYKEYGMFDTGIFATDILVRILFENGEEELAFKLLSSDKKYSFGNWMKNGATTLWEYWTGERSHNHPMFGACAKYLFLYILGIRQSENIAGYQKIVISPAHISLEKADGYIDFDYGRVSVSYQRKNGKIEFMITVPKNVDAEFIYGDSNFAVALKEGTNSFSCNDIPIKN